MQRSQQITQRLSEVYLLNEALMKEPKKESFSNTSLTLIRRFLFLIVFIQINYNQEISTSQGTITIDTSGS
jgi:hypothetical protein